MIKVLFICHGNICRSPAAEIICKKLIKERNLEEQIQVFSRATSREELGNPVYPPMRKVLHAKGYCTDGHIARQVQKSEFDSSDYVIVMDGRNIQNLIRMFGEDSKQKIHYLSEYATNFIGDVEDPWYSGNFDLVYDEIENGVAGFLDIIESKLH